MLLRAWEFSAPNCGLSHYTLPFSLLVHVEDTMLLQFEYEVSSQKAHVLKTWSTASGAIERWLDQEWISRMSSYWMVVSRWVLVKGRSLGTCLWRLHLVPDPFLPSLCFLTAMRGAASSAILLLPWLRPKAMEPANSGLKPSSTTKPSSFKLFISGFCHIKKKINIMPLEFCLRSKMDPRDIWSTKAGP
jgi:hypothetical protein